ncbi:MAG: SRPBCC family protein [Dysgonamonadaceae bacterium]|jgi:carbon monoxide dehydrogenase subunit G|nr:SRPBCC family protein [Dysgonamonadaceae bacterium]
MTEFTSEIKQLPYSETTIFEVLSDLNNLEKVKDQIPQDKVQDFSFDRDSCTFNVSPVGNVRFSIVEREPNKTIKFMADQLPVDVSLWIQLKEVNAQDTRMKLTVRANLNPFLKPMLSGPLQKGLDQIADVLAAVPYETLGEKHKD